MSASREPDYFSAGHLTPASPEQLKGVENIAHGLLQPRPVEMHRQYGLESEAGCIMFGTMAYLMSPGLIEASMSLADADEEPLIRFAFAADDEPSVFYEDSQALERVAPIVENLLEEDGARDPRERESLRALRALALSLLYDVGRENTFHKLTPGLAPRPLADVLRELVMERTNVTLHITDWNHQLNGHQKLDIVRNVIIPDEGLSMINYEEVNAPTLQIELTDTQARMNHCYIRTFGGAVILHAYNPNQLLEEEMMLNAAGASIADADQQADDMKAFTPTQYGVQLLTDKLLEAGSDDIDVPDDLSSIVD